jgi:hypothetical protein
LSPIADDLEKIAKIAVCAIRSWEATDETNPLFLRPFFDDSSIESQRFSENVYRQVTEAARSASNLIAKRIGVAVDELPNVDAESWRPTISNQENAARIFSYVVGVTYYRWNPNVVGGDQLLESSKLFEPLPLIPPGALINEASAGSVVVKSVEKCVALQREFGLVDHERGQFSNFASRIRQGLAEVFGDGAEDIESELCKALAIRDLELYIDKPTGFFADHLKQYSSNRRNAPIYWPLSTSSGIYTLWIYYPSLTSQTLYITINDLVEPKLKQVGADVMALRNKGVARNRDEEKLFESLQALELELIELRDTLLKIAPAYKPNQDDGVEINAAPLWSLFRHKPWQKLLKDTWVKLEKGDYDWANLALNYWPDRVREKCKTDKSLAIAHGLGHLFVEPAAQLKKTGKKKMTGGDK